MVENAKHMAGGRISAVQGLRAIAILLVVAYHAGVPAGAGYVGVDVFFVISGFVITRMVLKQSEGTGRIDFRKFWAGRIRRLLPALAVMVVITVLLTIPLGSPAGSQSDTALSGIGANLWIANAVLAFLTLGYFGARAEDNPLLHTWSLAVEEQFYILFPIVVAIGLLLARRRGWHRASTIGVLLAVVAVPSFLLSVLLTYVELPLPIGGALAFYSPVTRAWEFAAGAFVALALFRGWRPSERLTSAAGPLGVALLFVSLVAIREPSEFPGYIAALPVAATTLLVLTSIGDGWVSRLMASGPMVFIGDISYGWYLFHWPFLVYTRTFWPPEQTPWWADALAVVVSLVVAVLSFRFIEEPIRHRRVLGEMRSITLGVAIVLPALALSGLTFVGAAQGFGNSTLKDMRDQLDHGQWKYQAVCQSPVRVDKRDMEACTIPGTAKGRPIILMGDSNAGVYADALVAAAKELDRTVIVATVPSCPLVDVEQVELGKPTWIDCPDFHRASMEWLEEQGPAIVLIASGSAAVDSDAFGLREPDGSLATSTADKTAAWQASLVRTYQAVRQQGSTVVQLATVPHFKVTETRPWSPRSCRAIDVLRDADACGLSATRAEADAEQAGALKAEKAAARADGAKVIDLRGDLCPDDRCATNEGDHWFYEDGGHLSYPRAMEFQATFVERLRLLR